MAAFSRPAPIAVLLSGRGSNFEAIAQACEEGRLPARVAAVISDVPGAQGIARARRRGLPVFEVPRSAFSSPEAHEDCLAEILDREHVELVCLAGYMRLLSGRFVARYPLRILNVHPSLLPAFPGRNAQEQAVRYGVRVTGATVHFVDAGIDTGPIVAQETLRIDDTDDAASLARRLLPIEHRLYVAGVGAVLAGGWRIEGHAVRFGTASEKKMRS